MSHVRVHSFVVSIDGFGAGEPQSLGEPFGHTGLDLHHWMINSQAWRGDVPWRTDLGRDLTFHGTEGVGAVIMGRNMFSPYRGEMDEDWRGWWGENPPYHNPTFVMTHFSRPDLPMEGGTTFQFVSGSPSHVLGLAREAAGNKDVQIAGGASTLRAFFRDGLIDYAHIIVAPVMVGRGVRLWDDLGDMFQTYNVVETASVENAAHLLFVRK